MQWTVRSFRQKSKGWSLSRSSAAVGAEENPGAAAYADWQATTWKAMAVVSDRAFKTATRLYKSLL